MSINGGRGWWSTIEVPQGSRASETCSKHHPHARPSWHSWPQSSICKYPPFPPFLSCKDLNKVTVEFLSRQIWQFVIPLRCILHRKDLSNGVLAFWVAIVSTLQRFKWRFGTFRYWHSPKLLVRLKMSLNGSNNRIVWSLGHTSKSQH